MVSVYISKQRMAAIEASGKTITELIDLGLQALAGGKVVDVGSSEGAPGSRVPRRPDAKCPHPPARRAKGLCMACGTYVG